RGKDAISDTQVEVFTIAAAQKEGPPLDTEILRYSPDHPSNAGHRPGQKRQGLLGHRRVPPISRHASHLSRRHVTAALSIVVYFDLHTMATAMIRILPLLCCLWVSLPGSGTASLDVIFEAFTAHIQQQVQS